jgi:hypothetical protein
MWLLKALADAGSCKLVTGRARMLTARCQPTINDHGGNGLHSTAGGTLGSALAEVVNRDLTVRTSQLLDEAYRRFTQRTAGREDLNLSFRHLDHLLTQTTVQLPVGWKVKGV